MPLGAVGTNVLFAINTTGAAKSKAQWGIVAAAVVAVGAALNSVRKSAQEFSMIWSNLTAEQRVAGRAMDDAAKGMIDTTVAMKAQAVQAKAGIKANAELSEAMGKLVAGAGVKMGKSAKEITADLERLNEGITKGSTRALKEFGIDLENTEDLLLAQAEATEKVIEKSKEYTVEIGNMDHALFGLGNQFDTHIGLLYNWGVESVTASDAVTDMSDGIGAMNNLLMDTDGALLDVIVSTENLGTLFKLVATGPISAMNGELEQFITNMRNATLLEAARAKGKLAGEAEVAAAGDFYGPTLDQLGADKPPKPPRGGRRQVDEMTFTMEQVEAFRQDEDMGITGGAFADTSGVSIEALQSRSDLNTFLGEQLDLERELAELNAMTFSTEDIAAFESDIALMENARETQWLAELEQAEAEKQLAAEKHEWLLQNSEDYKNAQLAISRAEMMGRMDFMGQMFGNISALMNTENRKLFAIGKAAAIASATINTASAAVKAYEVGMQAGFPVGLVLGPAAAVAAGIAGAVQIATIAKTEFGSGAGGISNGASGAAGGGSFGGGAFSGGVAQVPTGSGGDQNISIYIGDEKLQDFLIKSNDNASQQGRPSFLMAG